MDDDYWTAEDDVDSNEPLAKRPKRAKDRCMSPFECEEMSGDDGEVQVPKDTEEDSHVRRSSLRTMALPDAVLNSDIHQVIRTFIQSGGTPEEAVDQLVYSYTGAADSCKLLLQWLEEVGEDPNSLILEFFQTTIQSHFNSQVADAIFEQRLSAPQWLEGMLSMPQWRQALYNIGATHSDSTLLKYTMQRVVEAGLHAEHPASPQLAANYFPLFTGAFAEYISKIMALENDALICSAEFQAFLELCLASHHSYIYAQALLVLLTWDPANAQQSSCFRRLLEELEVAAVRKGFGKVALRSSYLHHVMALNAKTAHQEKAAQVQAALQPMIVTGTTNPVDITKLHKLYSGDDCPLAEYIQNADFLELLLTDLFNPVKSIPASHKPKYTFLLAKACGTRSTRQPIQSDPAAPVAQMDMHLFASLASGSVVEDASEVPDILAAIETVMDMAERLEMDQINVKAFRPHLRYAVVSMGLIKWIDRKLQQIQEMTNNTEAAFTALLRLLAEIARTHPNQWPCCFELLSKYFIVISDGELESTSRVGYLKMILTGMLYLAKLGYVLPVLHTFADWLQSRTLDLSLIRTFLYRLLSTVQPPYSHRFVSALVPIILDAKVTEAISSSSLASSPVPHLVEFLQHITKVCNYDLSPVHLVRLRQMLSTLSVLPG